MREMLFHGKRTDNGEWIEGSLIISDEQYFIVPEFGVKSIDDLHCSKSQKQIMVFAFEVIPETVGQYTGLTDKNGKKIFEGDIVFYSYEAVHGVVEWDEESARFIIGDMCMWSAEFDELIAGEIEIVGNIHDNPELLEV